MKTTSIDDRWYTVTTYYDYDTGEVIKNYNKKDFRIIKTEKKTDYEKRIITRATGIRRNPKQQQIEW